MARFALLLLALLVAFVTVHAQNNGGAYQDPATGHWFAPDGKAKDGIFIPINFVKAGGVDKNTSNLWVNQVWTDKEFTVKVGQTVRFDYGKTHNVYLMPDEQSFNDCDFTAATPLGLSDRGDGPDLNDVNGFNRVDFELAQVGLTWFSCNSRMAAGSHCRAAGQKVRLNVDTATDGTCDDRIRNRHPPNAEHPNGQAEQGVDCGGPCTDTPCNTCFDGEMNNNEVGVDCGGDCLVPCPLECSQSAKGKFGACAAYGDKAACRGDPLLGCSWCDGGSYPGCYYGNRCIDGDPQWHKAACLVGGGYWDDKGAIKWCGLTSCIINAPTFGTNPNGYQERTSNYPAYSAAPTGMGDLLVDLIIVIAVVGALAGGFMGVNYVCNGKASNRAKERFDLGTSPVKV